MHRTSLPDQTPARVTAVAVASPSIELSDTTFAVDGMFCGGCASTIERALKRVSGVHDVSVSFLSDSAFISYDAASTSADALLARLHKLGYETRALDEAQSSRLQSNFQRRLQIRLAIAIGFGLWVMMAGMARYLTDLPDQRFEWWVALASGILSLPVLLFSGLPFFRLGWRGLLARTPGMESLILLATTAALTGSVVELWQGGSHVWFEVPVMLIVFQLIARLTDCGARRRAADAVRSMLDLSPERARRLDSNGFTSLSANELAVDDVIESRAGERIAGDGRVISGAALLDTSLLTGESLPASVVPGSDVKAGMLNTDGTIHVRITASGQERTLDQLAATVGRALNRKSDLMRLVDRVAGWLVPVISIAAFVALLLALVQGEEATEAIARALAVLVVSCPCALSLAVPLVISATAATAARNGIVLRDPASIEHAGRVDTVLMDKTGTLTEGKLTVRRITATAGFDKASVLQLAASIESGSNHPLARAITQHVDKIAGEVREQPGPGIEPDSGNQVILEPACSATGGLHADIVERHERAGAGVRISCACGAVLVAGSQRWLEEHDVVEIPAAVDASCSRVLIADGKTFIGAIEMSDTLRADAGHLLAALKATGMTPILVSGDTPGPVEDIARQLDMQWHAAVDPQGKSELVEQLNEQGHRVAFVGDGLNDALALSTADVGIATGDASDLARSAASVSILQDGLDRVDSTLRLLRRAAKVLRQNLVWAVLYNAILLPAAVLGFIHPVMAAIAMMLSASSVSLNSLRLLR